MRNPIRFGSKDLDPAWAFSVGTGPPVKPEASNAHVQSGNHQRHLQRSSEFRCLRARPWSDSTSAGELPPQACPDSRSAVDGLGSCTRSSRAIEQRVSGGAYTVLGRRQPPSVPPEVATRAHVFSILPYRHNHSAFIIALQVTRQRSS